MTSFYRPATARMRKEMEHLRFDTDARNVTSRAMLPLSSNGPYIDIHLGEMTEEAPIGQTYYLRPSVSYSPKSRSLTIHLTSSQPTIHMNSNSVSRMVAFDGTITVSDFEYGKYNPRSRVVANVHVSNRTGLPIRGFHVHDGEIVPRGQYKGYTNFGPIVFFLKTSRYWSRKSRMPGFPLPLAVATPMTGFLASLPVSDPITELFGVV